MSDDFEEEDYDEPEPSLDELKETAKTSWSGSNDRLRACVAVWHEEPEAGRDLLLALSIDLDVDDRLSALQRLLRMDPAAVAAASWLMWETEWGHLEGVHKYEAASIVPGHRRVEADLAAGLALIVANPHLDDVYRIWAGAYRVIEWTKDSFAELRALFSDTAILAGLDEVTRRSGQASGGVLIGKPHWDGSSTTARCPLPCASERPTGDTSMTRLLARTRSRNSRPIRPLTTVIGSVLPTNWRASIPNGPSSRIRAFRRLNPTNRTSGTWPCRRRAPRTALVIVGNDERGGWRQ